MPPLRAAPPTSSDCLPEWSSVTVIGRPDDEGNKPTTVVALTTDLAELLAIHLVEIAQGVRRAQ